LTAAHCVQESNSYTKLGEMYITNPIDNTWFKIDNDKIYIDGVADIALIETLIDYDLILSYTINNVKTEVGVVPSQRTLGQLLYSKSNVISIEYIRNSDKTKITENVTIDKTYETVPANYDLMLVGGAPS
jgi:hypothetical protein